MVLQPKNDLRILGRHASVRLFYPRGTCHASELVRPDLPILFLDRKLVRGRPIRSRTGSMLPSLLLHQLLQRMQPNLQHAVLSQPPLHVRLL